MSISQIAVFIVIAGALITVQMGRRQATVQRFLIPVTVVGFVAYSYLRAMPTMGGDLDFEVLCALAGSGLGILAAFLVRVERDNGTGRVMMQAGIAYAALWILVIGGRMAFAWLASNSWRDQVGQFSMSHAITGAPAWTAAFLLMTVTMVLARTAVLGTRVLLLNQSQSEPMLTTV